MSSDKIEDSTFNGKGSPDSKKEIVYSNECNIIRHKGEKIN